MCSLDVDITCIQDPQSVIIVSVYIISCTFVPLYLCTVKLVYEEHNRDLQNVVLIHMLYIVRGLYTQAVQVQ